MEKNVKMRTIRKAIKGQNDDVLQHLYRRAAGESISPLMIMRLWYGQVDLSKQPRELIDFLFRALEEGDDCPETEYRYKAEVSTDDLDGPWALSGLIEEYDEGDEGDIAPVLVVLAWMGFEMDEVLGIYLEEIDLLMRTIRGRMIPTPLCRTISRFYIQQHRACLEETCTSRTFGRNRFLLCSEDGGRATQAIFAATMERYGLSYEDIRMAGERDRSRQNEGRDAQTDL